MFKYILYYLIKNNFLKLVYTMLLKYKEMKF